MLNVTGLGPDPAAARDRAYDAAGRISFDGMQIRSDIAARAVAELPVPDHHLREEPMSDIADPEQPETGTAIPAPDPAAEAQLEQIEEGFETSGTLVAILVDSKNEMEKMLPAEKYLTEQGIQSELHIMSAHREAETVREFCSGARARGLKVIIAGAGMSAALPGAAAAHTDLPVIGVPILGASLGGLDALLSAVQMPPGVPVACVAIDGAKNAGMLAARIINA